MKKIFISLILLLFLSGCTNGNNINAPEPDITVPIASPSSSPDIDDKKDSYINESKKENKKSKAKPILFATDDGIYNDIESLHVEINSEFTIRYTLDGTRPTYMSKLYTEPLELNSTAVLRAACFDLEDVLITEICKTYIINECFSLPVLSLVSNEPIISKDAEVPGYISFFNEDGCVFNSPCGTTRSGRTSYDLGLSKSYNVYFRKIYGSPKLKCDVFNSGVKKYESLNIRGGYPVPEGKFTQDVWQSLAQEISGDIITQHSIFCILYVNGQYNGIRVLKENIGKSFYAGLLNVNKSSVEDCKPPNTSGSFYDEVYLFCINNDMSDLENYQHISEILDIDNFIDWSLIQGISSNIDLQYNVRMFKSYEKNGKWQFVLYDLDGGRNPYPWSTFLSRDNIGLYNPVVTGIFTSLFNNYEFRAKFLTRYSSLWDTGLSTASILNKIEEYEKLLYSDVERDRGFDSSVYYYYVNKMKSNFADNNWQYFCVRKFCEYMDIPDNVRQYYFGF